MTTPYDTVAYPSMIFEQSHPERLQMTARVHGLAPPPVETARVLEIGGGDGLNAIVLAAAYPNAHFVSFDLAPTAVAKGRALVEASGLTNVEVVVGDIMDGCRTYAAGSFDYIIAHGVYAWVPEPVRKALMELVGHALSPDGVAFISYNALPGGHIRMAMRDMLFHALEGVEGVDARIGTTLKLLKLFAEPQQGDDAVVTAMRAQAASMLERPEAVLFHDELGDIFAPQSLTQVVDAAADVGLIFLSDETARKQTSDGFLPDDLAATGDLQARVVRAAQAADYATVRFFRQSLFVRAGRAPDRIVDTGRLDGLWMSCSLKRNEDGSFQCGKSSVRLDDDELAAMLDILSASFPERFPVMEKVTDPLRRQALLNMFAHGFVYFHEGPVQFPLTIGSYPKTSPLVREALIAKEARVPTLAHRQISIDQPNLVALLLAADGSRTIAELAALSDLDFPADQIEPALNAAASRGLLIA